MFPVPSKAVTEKLGDWSTQLTPETVTLPWVSEPNPNVAGPLLMVQLFGTLESEQVTGIKSGLG